MMKKRNSRVSVVIPAFNESKTIRKVVTAVMKAKNVDEIVVVDDGSTDGTSKNIEDLNIKIIRHTENKGKGEAIKTGIKNSIGKIILFLDCKICAFAIILAYLVDKFFYIYANRTTRYGR